VSRSALGRPGVPESVLKLVVLGLAVLAVVVPFVGIAATSLSSKEHLDTHGGFVLWPDAVSLDAYRTVLSGGVVSRALAVSDERGARPGVRRRRPGLRDAGARLPDHDLVRHDEGRALGTVALDPSGQGVERPFGEHRQVGGDRGQAR